MVEREIHKVTIDFCCKCKGVWLDPGELQPYLGVDFKVDNTEGVFLCHAEIEIKKQEYKAARSELGAEKAVNIGVFIFGQAWDLPAYLVNGIFELLDC